MRRVLLTLLLVSCTAEQPLVVGSKVATENIILAEMIARLAREANIPVETHIPYGNTFACQEGIKAKEIDLYPEYTGTGLSMLGVPPVRDPEDAYQRIKKLTEPYGLKWLPRFGVNNSYVLVMRKSVAARLGIEQVSDLTRSEQERLRFGVGEEYTSRTVDGMAALERRYGLSNADVVLKSNDKKTLYYALINEQIDVVMGYGTDGQIEKFGLKVLEDDLEFFPAYEVAPVVRADALERFPQLAKVGQKLKGSLDNRSMQRLNMEVELNGAAPEVIAGSFLHMHGQLEIPKRKRTVKLVLGVTPTAQRRIYSPVNGRALSALRYASPGRLVDVAIIQDPITAISSGEVYVGVLGAEGFFDINPGALPKRTTRIEAIAPIGNRMVHLLTTSTLAAELSERFMAWSQIGVGVEGSASHRVAKILQDAYGRKSKIVFGDLDQQIEALIAGRLPVLLRLVEPGDPTLAVVIKDQRLALLSFSDWRREDRSFRYPFLRSARIPKGTYANITTPVETLASQVVLVGPGHQKTELGPGGPGSVLEIARKPIPVAVKRKLRKAIAVDELIDPTLPGKDVSSRHGRVRTRSLTPSPGVPIMNAMVLLMLGLFVLMLVRMK